MNDKWNNFEACKRYSGQFACEPVISPSNQKNTRSLNKR